MVKNGPIQETFPLEPNSTPSLHSSETKTAPIFEIKLNPKSGNVQLENAPLNTKNTQKMDENKPCQCQTSLTLVLHLSSNTSHLLLWNRGALAWAWPCVGIRHMLDNGGGHEDERMGWWRWWYGNCCVMNGQFFIFSPLLHYRLLDHPPNSSLQCAPSIPFITAPIYGYMHSWHSIVVLGSLVSELEKDHNQTRPRPQKTRPVVHSFHFWDVKTTKRPV